MEHKELDLEYVRVSLRMELEGVKANSRRSAIWNIFNVMALEILYLRGLRRPDNAKGD